MNKIIALAAALAVSVLAGCATPPPVAWHKAGATQEAFDQDFAKCRYEAVAATQTTDTSMRSIFGQELDRAIRQRDLMDLCLQAKEWRQ